MDAVHGKPGTHLGEIEDPDGFGEHGSMACGDAMRFTFRVQRHPTDPTQDVIVAARYLTFGCTSAIAASEALCIADRAGQLHAHPGPEDQQQGHRRVSRRACREQKIHCSVMGAEALEVGRLQLGPAARRRPGSGWASTSTPTSSRKAGSSASASR